MIYVCSFLERELHWQTLLQRDDFDPILKKVNKETSITFKLMLIYIFFNFLLN